MFGPSQPHWIISGLKETFIKRYKVERTNKAEIRSEGRDKTGRTESENGELSGELMVVGRVESAIKSEIDTRTE